MNRIFVSQSERTHFQEQLGGFAGLEILRSDPRLPAVQARLESKNALSLVRRLPFIDYVEPSLLRRTGTRTSNPADAHPTASTQSSYSDSSLGCEYKPYGGSHGYTFAGDVLPPRYVEMRVDDAWAYATGDGVVVGVVDTGVHQDQPELNESFATGYSGGRWHGKLATYGTSWHDDCSHGTRIAGVIGAPMNGTNVAGVTWKAHMVSIRADPDVVFMDSYRAATAIWDAAGYRADETDHRRIINMAWNSDDDANYVSDAIRFNYANGVLFIAASGTSWTAGDWITGVVFPAEMSEVVAVSAVDGNKQKTASIHYGQEVEVAAYINQVTTGRSAEEIVSLGGSSGASAIISGIAALLWDRYSTATRDEIREKLRRAGHYYPNRNDTFGYGVVNAYKGVGGLYFVAIDGPTQVQPSTATQYTYSANLSGGTGPFSYSWSVDNPQIELSSFSTESIEATVEPGDSDFTLTLDVTDGFDNHTARNWKTVGVLDSDCEPGKTCDNLIGQ